MAKRFALAGLTVAAALTSFTTFAQKPNLNGTTNTVTTAVPFLRISPDARAGAMGDVGIATSPDANAQHWNVVKLPFAEIEKLFPIKNNNCNNSTQLDSHFKQLCKFSLVNPHYRTGNDHMTC